MNEFDDYSTVKYSKSVGVQPRKSTDGKAKKKHAIDKDDQDFDGVAKEHHAYSRSAIKNHRFAHMLF
jgi:hypothetical protein